MNWLDRAVALIDPVAGVRRAQARLALDQVRMYEAAKVGRRTEGWLAGSTSANAEVLPSLARVRNRCRQVVRDNEYASRGLDALVAYTVGTGPVAKAPDQALWDRWTRECDLEGQLDFGGIIEGTQRCRREAGESLIRLWHVDPSTMEVPLKLQALEPDHLDETKTGPVGLGGNMCIAGVEFNATGQRVAYWIFPTHPGEVVNFRASSLQSVRVPASEILHYYRKRRLAQVRGMPELATALLRLRDLADYEMAELVRKKIEACFVAFVQTDDPHAQLGDTNGQAKGPPRQEKMSPGMIKYLRNGEGVHFGSPSSSGGYVEYNGTQLRAIAAGAGCTYEDMTGDHSQQSFSGGRLSKLALRPLIEQEQWLALAPMVLNPIAARFQQVARLAGRQKGATAPITWTMPRMQMGDLLKEALGIKELIKGGLISLPEGIRELGYDPDTVLKENKDYQAQLRDAGVMVDTDPAVALKLLPPEKQAQIFDSLLKDTQ